jgi:hypothetical protein
MRIRHVQIGVLCTLFLFALPASALTPQDITFPDRVQAGPNLLSLHGASPLHYLKLLPVYVAGLYLPEGAGPQHVLSDIPKQLEIGYLVPIKGSDFGKGAQPILERNQTPAAMAQLQSRIDRINAAYRDVKPGDRYALTYLPGRGTELALNGVPLITLEGADFASAYFGIWLGRQPIDEGLKRALLRSR